MPWTSPALPRRGSCSADMALCTQEQGQKRRKPQEQGLMKSVHGVSLHGTRLLSLVLDFEVGWKAGLCLGDFFPEDSPVLWAGFRHCASSAAIILKPRYRPSVSPVGDCCGRDAEQHC